MESFAFVTPSIRGWVLLVGYGVPSIDASGAPIMHEVRFLERLSAEFGEAQYFYSNRVDSTSVWVRAIAGKTERLFGNFGSDSQSFSDGAKTEVEAQYNIFEYSVHDEAKREDYDYPGEDLLMAIAEDWSINPSLLGGSEPQSVSTGYLCTDFSVQT
jgi:hypothetical protein